MGYMVFNVRIDVSASDCTRGCTDSVQEFPAVVEAVKAIQSGLSTSALKEGMVFNSLGFTAEKTSISASVVTASE